jgi:hypothetical protein
LSATLRRLLERRWLRDRAQAGVSEAEYEKVWRFILRLKVREFGLVFAWIAVALFSLSLLPIAWGY